MTQQHISGGYQHHSATSRMASSKLSATMEAKIFNMIDRQDSIRGSGWTGDALAVALETEFPGVQTGTVAARLRGLELKGLAIKSTETRLTRSKKQAHVWYSARLHMELNKTKAAVAAVPASAMRGQAADRVRALESLIRVAIFKLECGNPQDALDALRRGE